MSKNNFRFWLPIEEITKSKDKEGKEVMILGGLASTKSRDTDGEILDPSGFDIEYLIKRGVTNWNHSKAPEDCIGEVQKAEIRKEGLYVESMLYPDSKKAKKVYELAQTLKNNSKTRRLGISKEGKALDRDPLDQNHVTRAFVSNVALTLSPKNPDSIVDIIKGNYNGWDDDEQPPIDLEKGFDFETADGGQQHIIDITRPDGVRIIVDKDYNIKMNKALAATSDSGVALTREHVDGETKDQMNGKLVKKGEENELENEIDNEIEKSLNEDENGNQSISYMTKDEVIQKILSTDSVISFEKANEIYKTLNSLTMATEKTKITEDLLEKSLAKLKIEKSVSVDPEDEDDEEEDEGFKKSTKVVAKKDKIEKGMDTEDEDDEDDEIEKKVPVKKKKEKMEKAVEAETDNSQLVSEIDDLKEMVKSLAVIAKGSYDLAKAQSDEINSLKEQIEEFGETPVQNGRKSLTKGVDRNFKKSMGDEEDEIEKGNNDGVPHVNVDRARNQVINMLDHLAFNKNGYQEQFAKALTMFESAKIIAPDIQKSIENEFKVKLVR